MVCENREAISNVTLYIFWAGFTVEECSFLHEKNSIAITADSSSTFFIICLISLTTSLKELQGEQHHGNSKPSKRFTLIIDGTGNFTK